MKGLKPNQEPKHRKLTSSTPKLSDIKLPELKPTVIIHKKPKENTDSKPSTQDRSRKLDSSQHQIKDISHIMSESLLCDDPCSEESISGISIINMLEQGGSKPLPKELLNFEPEDNEALKRDLEMKNRLIEKLMKENASLREEMEAFLTNIEEVKDHQKANAQDSSHRISELENHIVQLEGENKSLREQLGKKSEEEEKMKVAKAQALEKQIERYSEYTKMNMEDFYVRMNEQVQTFMETSRRQHENFSKIVHSCVEEIKHGGTDQHHNLTNSTSLLSYKSDHRMSEIFQDKKFTREGFMTQSFISQTSRNDDSGTKMSLSARKMGFDSHMSRTNLNSYPRIDEDPELKLDRRSSVMVAKSYKSARTSENKENQSQSMNKKVISRNSAQEKPASRSIGKVRGSTGGFIEKKRLEL